MAEYAAASIPSPIGRGLRPDVLAHERVLEVLPPLGELLTRLPNQRGLRRGSVVGCGGGAGLSLALALAAGPSAGGAWVGMVGLGSVGLAAAAELGVALERMFLVAEPPPKRWAEVVAAVAEGAEVVLARAPTAQSVRPAEIRRVQTRLTNRGAVLILVDADRAAFGADLELTATPLSWEGIGAGHGRLLARRVRIEIAGRRAGRPVVGELWLPGADGKVASAAPSAIPLRPRQAG